MNAPGTKCFYVQVYNICLYFTMLSSLVTLSINDKTPVMWIGGKCHPIFSRQKSTIVQKAK